MLPRIPVPPPPALLALIALAFALPGLGHDPWKSLDAYGVAIVHAMHATGDWLVPSVAGQVWLADPPLYHWLALASAKLLGWLLPLHAGARIASALCLLAALAWLYLAARAWSREDEGREPAAAAVLVLAGSVGLTVRAHEAIPDLAALAATAAALAALATVAPRLGERRDALRWGAACGAAIGAAFLATGFLGALPAAVGIAAGFALCGELRARAAGAFLVAAALVAALLAALWPLALWVRSPALPLQWWDFVSAPGAPLLESLRYYLVATAWFAWPAWPLALWTLWALRMRWREPRIVVPAAAALAALAGQVIDAQTQSVNLIVALAPLALLAAFGVPRLLRGAAAALDWFGVMTFAFFAALVWLGYLAQVTGVPPRMANNFVKSAPGFVAQFELWALLVALALAALWLATLLLVPAGPSRAVLRWAAGLALLWGSFATQWMQWTDYQKSYRAVALQLRSKIPVASGCIAQKSLGLPQAAALDYHAGVRTQPFDALRPNACRLLLVQGSPKHEFDGPGAGWEKLADLGRPGDKAERFRLYRRTR
jgi:4-amino-4-deoxy-L-arabinose transferase-like glycosyltransferase